MYKYSYINVDPKKQEDITKGKIGPANLMKVLTFLGSKPSKSDVNLIIWVSLIDH
jgi:hypothetical protein